MRRCLPCVALLLIVGGVVLLGCSSSSTTTSTVGVTSSSAPATTAGTTVTTAAATTETTAGATGTTAVVTGDATAGKVLFEANCATCHGPNGHAGPGLKGVDLKDAVTDPTQETLGTIQNGIPPKMPAWKGKLSITQINDIIAWIQAGLK